VVERPLLPRLLLLKLPLLRHLLQKRLPRLSNIRFLIVNKKALAHQARAFLFITVLILPKEKQADTNH
jgi:hypothetical protein